MELEHIVEKFWKGLEKGIIYARKCKECGEIEFPPHIACNNCGYHETEWTTLSGKGMLKSFVFTGPMNARLELEDKGEHYVCGEVQLEEGPAINAIVVGVKKKKAREIEPKLPVPVHAKFYPMDGYTTLYFELDD